MTEQWFVTKHEIISYANTEKNAWIKWLSMYRKRKETVKLNLTKQVSVMTWS